MATFTRLPFNASLFGRGIIVPSAGVVVHTTLNSNTILDEVWLYAHNTSSVNEYLRVLFGDTSLNDYIEFTVPAEKGMYLIVPGLILRGTGGAGSIVRAVAATNNVINVFGYINRITP